MCRRYLKGPLFPCSDARCSDAGLRNVFGGKVSDWFAGQYLVRLPPETGSQ